jgi:CHAT domain-containing protein
MDADSLAKVIDREEHLLVESSKALGDYTKNLAISWRDVQKNLKDNDLAIEFATVKDTVAKQLVYVAFVLKQGMSAPEFVKLFNLDDFYDIKTKEFYTTPKLYNLVWQPLAVHLKNAKTVYFSPAGQLHTIGIEYLSGDDGKIFAEQYDTYRLSSTRELAMTYTINPNKKAATYGGIKYNFTEEDWQNLKEEHDNMERGFQDSPQVEADLRGGGVDYLIGSMYESDAVAGLLRSAEYDVYALSGDVATEESFKALSGSGLQILHIGTHGFYESEADLVNADRKFYTNSQQQSDEDRSLSCSGLLFAGVNSTLDPKRNREIPEGFDDGVLTAKEISRLDFSGLDLVVLSACQTGLGEITGEGVFGLQRGFKKAGAQTLVMSLWKVFDDSTQMLMTEFFKNLTAGMTKRAAFIAAQGKVRAQFPDPKHWAAFVMVDGE